MKKAILQGLLTVAVFFTTWFALAQIDWVALFKVQRLTNNVEAKLGSLFLDIVQKTEKENKNLFVTRSVDSLVNKICSANGIDRKSIKVHIVYKDEINAFALPGGNLIIYSSLILNSDSQEELSGVIGHEIAHIELNHVMKKLIKEVGLSVLISMTTGNSSPEIIQKAAKLISSSAFDRSLEKEADIKAVDYLVKAKINPRPFAHFLYKLAEKEKESKKYLTWISTHPESKERAAYIIDYSKSKMIEYQPIVTAQTWSKLKENLNN